MSDRVHPGAENLQPWKPGQSGNPEGSSKRARARTVARRIGGLAPALRELLDEQAPESLLATLTEEQRAAIDGDFTLARYLGARLVTSAASARSFSEFLSALSLIGQIDTKATGEDESATGDHNAVLQALIRELPLDLGSALIAALRFRQQTPSAGESWVDELGRWMQPEDAWRVAFPDPVLDQLEDADLELLAGLEKRVADIRWQLRRDLVNGTSDHPVDRSFHAARRKIEEEKF